MAALIGITLTSLVSNKSSKELDITAQTIAAKLNEARSNAIAGKDGSNFGIKLNASSYVYFSGASYNSSDPNNVTFTVPSDITLSYNIPGPDYAVIFTRMTGAPQGAYTITITKTGTPSGTETISIGSLGDVSVIK